MPGLLDQRLGAGAGDQDGRADLELESHELLVADQVGNGLPVLAAAGDEPAEARLLARGEGRRGGAQRVPQGKPGDVGRDQLDIGFGMIDALGFEILARLDDLVHIFFASALSFSSRSHLRRRSISSSMSPWRNVSRLWTEPEAPRRVSVMRLSG